VKSVLVNGRFLAQRVTGVQRYGREILRAVDRLLGSDLALGQRWTFAILIPPGTPKTLPLSTIACDEIGHLQGHLWEQLELPRHAGRELLLNLCNTAPIMGRNMISTLHDASVYAIPEAYSAAFRLWYRTMIPMLGRRSRRVVTVSRFSRMELERRAGIPRASTIVIPESGEHILGEAADETVLERLRLRSQGYVLAVSSQSPHKNLLGLERAAALLTKPDIEMVVVGAGNSRVFSPWESAGTALRYTGYVSDPELRALYENALCFVFPSFYEGFGLPALEAMSCGCPVVVSHAASLPEVCGEAAVYCDPRDPADIATAIRTVLDDCRLRDDLRRRGKERAAHFTWDRAARSLLSLIDTLPA
jgi:glycosyltransferase involved in cell wall biosynthesis